MRNGRNIGFMTRKQVLWIVGLLILAWLLWLIFRKPKSDQTRIQPSKPDQAATIVNQVRKNSKGTLSLVGVNSTTGSVVSQKELSFDEAVKLVGNVTDVCVGRYNVGSAYAQCVTLRKA